MIDSQYVARVTRDKNRIIELFDAGDWNILAAYLNEQSVCITGHPRLLRSLYYGDDDYPTCVGEVLGNLVRRDVKVLDLIEGMLDEKSAQKGADMAQEDNSPWFGSGQTVKKKTEIDTSLVAAMMPFRPEFDDVRETMRRACAGLGLTLKTADEVWESTIIIQDVINLISRACIVIVDLTSKNPNVFYETGIAHALGKEVIPITQSNNDVPFDLRHIRHCAYDNNAEGRAALQQELERRMRTILDAHGWRVIPF